MLGDKNGMSAHRGLFAVIRDLVRSWALPNKTFGVAADGVPTFVCNIAFVPGREAKTASEG